MVVQAGKYRDIAELGRGGMGDVYLTVTSGPAGFNKLLVVKRLRQSLSSDPEFLQMFLNEARTAARLNHPNIVQTYDVGFDGSRYYIAMEYLQGQSMSQLLRASWAMGGLPLAMQLRVIVDALSGLDYAHEQRDYDGSALEIVHRDVSPPNIFVLYDGQVKLVDFGIAKTAQSGETRAGVFKGKVQYVAPEQYAGGPIDRRTDIYSAGVILWEAVTQRRMWRGVGDLTIMQRVVAGDLPLPSSVEPQVPKQLESICMRALSLQREDRYPTAAAFQGELEAFMNETGERASAREVGKYTADLFADNRSRMKVIIDNQLRILRETADPLSLIPIVAPQQATLTDSASWMPRPLSLRALGRWRMTSTRVAAGTLLLLAAWIAFFFGRRSATVPGSSAPLPALSSPSSPAATETMASPKPARLRLIVNTLPRSAKVLLDDAPLPSDRRELDLPRDEATHRISAAAPGYRAKVEWVRFDVEHVAIDIVLDPYRAHGQRRSADGKEARRSSTVPQPALGAENPPLAQASQAVAPAAMRELDFPPMKRPAPLPNIDTEDPWR